MEPNKQNMSDEHLKLCSALKRYICSTQMSDTDLHQLIIDIMVILKKDKTPQFDRLLGAYHKQQLVPKTTLQPFGVSRELSELVESKNQPAIVYDKLFTKLYSKHSNLRVEAEKVRNLRPEDVGNDMVAHIADDIIVLSVYPPHHRDIF